MSDLIPNAVYHVNDANTYRSVVIEKIDDIEVDGEFPVFVIVNDETRSEPGKMWTVESTGLACDDDKGVSGLFEGRLLDDIERKSGESWRDAIVREMEENSDDSDYSYELAAEGFARGGMTGYNEAMGYGTVDDPDEYGYDDEW